MAEALLVIREGSEAGREVALAGAVTIGRAEGADLVLGDTGISRSHARVTPEGVGAVIEDLGSSNGTFVNGERIEDPRRLRDGDEIQLGGALIAFAGGTEETRLMADTDPDATEAHPGPGAAGAGAAAAAAASPPTPAEPHAPASAPAEPEPPWDPIPMPKPRREPPRAAAPPRREPIPQPRPAPPAPRDEVNDWNLPALAAIVLGPAAILMIALSSGSSFFAALPIAIAAIALGTIGRNKVDRGESRRFRGFASAGRTFGIVGTVLAAVILIAVIAINQFLDVGAESITELIDEVRQEIESR